MELKQIIERAQADDMKPEEVREGMAELAKRLQALTESPTGGQESPRDKESNNTHPLGLCQEDTCAQCSGALAAVATAAQDQVFELLDPTLVELGLDDSMRERIVARYNERAEALRIGQEPPAVDDGQQTLGQDDAAGIWLRDGDKTVQLQV